MSEIGTWLASNDHYLAVSMKWLRTRLEQLASSGPAHSGQAHTSCKSSFFSRLFHRKPAPSNLPLQTGPATAAIPKEMIESETAEQPPALVLLSRRLGLSEFERYTLLLCVAMELDTRIGELCAHAQRDSSRPFPTFALALALFDQPAWEVLSPDRPLRYWRLIEINQSGIQPLISSALKADERIVNYLKGLNYLDDRLSPLMRSVAIEDAMLPVSQSDLADSIVKKLERLDVSALLPVFQLLGSDSQSKLMIACHAANRLGLTLYRMQADVLPSANADYDTFVRLWQRESMLLPIALLIDAVDIDRASNSQVVAVHRLFTSGMGLVFLDTREPWPDLAKESLLLDIVKPTPGEQLTAWKEVLGDAAGNQASRLVSQFNFNIPMIHAIAASAMNGDSQTLADKLWHECLNRTRPALDQLAQALEPKATWEDIELPALEKNLLHQIAEQVRSRSAVYDDWGFRQRMNRGFGISVLFAGESGTGKTMAAEVIANELGLLLYRIDLSAVVSKYIGETEKNLRKLFDVAEDGGAILFFDEADALFGKRSEVKDSHDRYANIEINYLLQRMEAYRGLAILATNMKAALDGAFLRRLRFIVNFPFPSADERKAIWQKAFPQQSPLGVIDYERLAGFNLTGGSIHNIALNAAFLAAHSTSKIGMTQVMEAMRTELRKLEKPINEADFRWQDTAEVRS